MGQLATAFHCWQTKIGDIDDILSTGELSHMEYRQWCHDNNKPMPSPSPGLAMELIIEHTDVEHYKLLDVYSLTQHELNHCLHNDFYKSINKTKLEVQHARDNGATELQITELFGAVHTNKALLSSEINTHIKNGVKQLVLAEWYRLSPGRISQLNKCRRSKPKLTDEQKHEIYNSRDQSAQSLAKKYGVTKNTIYVVWRS